MKISHWSKKQKRHHAALWMDYRKEQVLEWVDIFLSVNHPEWAVKRFLEEFEGNRKTFRQLFARVLICGGDLAYSEALPYQNDLERLIGFMKLRQYIEIKEDMLFKDIMKLPMVFDLSKEQRNTLRNQLLHIEA